MSQHISELATAGTANTDKQQHRLVAGLEQRAFSIAPPHPPGSGGSFEQYTVQQRKSFADRHRHTRAEAFNNVFSFTFLAILLTHSSREAARFGTSRRTRRLVSLSRFFSSLSSTLEEGIAVMRQWND